MPTYQYACTECGHALEAVQSFSDDALTTCPQCTGRLRKVFNSVGIVFKGSGFYRTDSREKPAKESADGAKAGGKDGKSSDAKPTGDAKTPAASTTSSSSTGSSAPSTAKSGSSTAGSAA